MKIVNLLIGGIILSIFVSCSSSNTTTDTSGMYPNGDYILTDNNEVFKNYQGQDITMTIDNETHNIKGNSSCNQFFIDTYQINAEGYFNLGPIASTKKYCPDMNIERTFFDLLNNSNKYKMENGYLYLYKDDLLLLTFRLSN